MSAFLSSLLFLFLSMHACFGRHLGINNVPSAAVSLSGKDVIEKTGKQKSEALKHSPFKEVSDLKEVEKSSSAVSTFKESEEYRGGGRTNQKKEVSSKAFTEEVNEMKSRISSMDSQLVSVSNFRVPRLFNKRGSETILSSDVGLQQSTKIQESEMQGRLVLGTESHVMEETIGSPENGPVEDVVGMDYERPQRNPPIHNLAP
ncbi:hypothetical protein Syun_012531 [Stephania yunnanensis]|uniref:Uncharacterized protein n=1 Tax=Stephania yunnanensis TaxID=152371 RepID=A0AAP0JZT2_9MAGN